MVRESNFSDWDYVEIMLPSNTSAFLKSRASDEGPQLCSRYDLLDVTDTTEKLTELSYLYRWQPAARR